MPVITIYLYKNGEFDIIDFYCFVLLHLALFLLAELYFGKILSLISCNNPLAIALVFGHILYYILIRGILLLFPLSLSNYLKLDI
jgi:hypothetical protein